MWFFIRFQWSRILTDVSETSSPREIAVLLPWEQGTKAQGGPTVLHTWGRHGKFASSLQDSLVTDSPKNESIDSKAQQGSQIWASFNRGMTKKSYPGLGLSLGYFLTQSREKANWHMRRPETQKSFEPLVCSMPQAYGSDKEVKSHKGKNLAFCF